MLLTIDMFTNNASVNRTHTQHAISVGLVYFLMVNLPYTLAENSIYEYIDYTSVVSYLLFLYFFLLFVVAGEIGHRLKKRIIYNRKRSEFLPLDSQ